METEEEQEEEESDSEDKSPSPLLRIFLTPLPLSFFSFVDGSVLFGELVQSLAYSGVIWRLKASIIREGISFVTRGRRGGRKHVEEPSARERSEEREKEECCGEGEGEKEEVRDSVDT
jgi:hypothetical protein